MSLSLKDQLPWLVFIISCVFLARRLQRTLFRDKNQVNIWDRIESSGVPSGILPWTRAAINSLFSIERNASNGYEKICKAKGKPFALPTMWLGLGGAVIILPPSKLPLLNKSRNEITTYKGLLDTIQLPYMITDPDIFLNNIHFDVLRKKLTNKDVVNSLAIMTADEMDIAFRESWGTSKQWKTVNGWQKCEYVMMRAAMRTLIGLPMSRDEALLKETSLYVNSLFAATGIINCLPPIMRPMAAPLLAMRAKYHQSRCVKMLVPLIEERIHLWKEGAKEGGNEPNDFLQWMIPVCGKVGPEQMEPGKIALRLLALSTMFVFASAYVFGQCVLDLYGSPSEAGNDIITGLEEECKRISAKYHGFSTKEAVDSLYRLDSTLRESMRVSNVWVTTFPMEVLSGKIDIGDGIQIPPGIRMAFPTQAMHLDPEYYKDPQRFDAFRFSRDFEGLEESEQQSAERELVTVPTESFVAFGYGRSHSCPGRWFAAQSIKQGLAHIVSNYDVELIGKPIKRRALLTMILPPTGAQMRIRQKS